MLIPNKFNGYSRDGIRLYHSGGGGARRSGPPPPNPNSWEAMMASRGTPVPTPSAAPVNVDAAPVALTPEQRQTDITRDLSLSQVSGARPSSQDSQFYQPVYQPQYTNYATTNPLGVSQYGTPTTARSLVDSAYAGVGRYGSGNQTNQVDPGGRQYWENSLNSGSLNPQDFFNVFSSAVNQARQNPNDRYGQYYQNQTGYGGGFMPQMQSAFSYNPQPQMNWQTGQMTQPAQPQMQTPFSYQQPMQQPMQQAQTNYGPSQAIVGRSSQMRGTPSVMRRAEGGIASLLDNDE